VPRKTGRRKLIVLVVAIVVAIAAAVGAYAYWSASGTGTGAATAGTDSGVTVAGDPANGVYPGGSVAVTSVITNSSSTAGQFVTNLHVTISIDATHALAGCLATWFTYKSDAEASGTDSNPHSTAVNTQIAAAGTTSVAGHVFMANPNTNQDACKGATLNLAYAVNNT
jgi:flagellar basal body-associated protein FliL